MPIKHCIYTSEDVAAFDLTDIELSLGLGIENFIFSYSPDALRTICERSPAAQRLLSTKLAERYYSRKEDAVTLYERQGFARAMSDQEWLGKMMTMAKNIAAGESFLIDIDEIGFPEAYAAKEKRLAEHAVAAEARRRNAQNYLKAKGILPDSHTEEPPVIDRRLRNPPVTFENAAVPDTKPELHTQEAATDSPPSSGVFFDAVFFNGQLQVSNVVTGSRLVTMSTGTRQSWSASNPLVVSRISGILAETTTIEYVGEELRVAEIETWATSLRFGAQAKDERGERLPLGADVRLSEREMLKVMRRGDSSPEYKALRKQISRLQSGKLIITTTYERLIEAIAAAMPEDEDAQAALTTKHLRIVVTLLGDSTSSAKENTPGTITISIPTRVRALFGKGLSA